MGVLKNLRYEHFARELIRTGDNSAEAYRRIVHRFPRKRTGYTNPNSPKVVGWQLRHRPEIKRRYWELREIMAKKSDITIEKVLTDIQEAMNIAKRQDKPNDVINAAMAQAKLVGLLRDRVETGAVGDFDDLENVSDILEKVALEQGPEVALALAKAFGLANADSKDGNELAQAIPPSDAVN